MSLKVSFLSGHVTHPSQEREPLIEATSLATLASPLFTQQQHEEGNRLFNGILQMPAPLKGKVVECLSLREASALEIALGKGTRIHTDCKIARLALLNLVEKDARLLRLHRYYNNRVLPNIYRDHPDWKALADQWQNVSLDDKVWILRAHDLMHYMQTWQFKGDCDLMKLNNVSMSFGPERSGNFEHVFHRIFYINIEQQYAPKLKFPDSISLFVNLKILRLQYCDLEKFPNLTDNDQLEEIHFHSVQWVASTIYRKFPPQNPPDVSMNRRLKVLRLVDCCLNAAPDVRNNPKLTELNLNANQITIAPDLSQNPDLVTVELENNPLHTLPKFSPQCTPKLAISAMSVSSNLWKQYVLYPNQPECCCVVQ